MGLRAKMDASDQSMGWKAAEYEMKGIPLRVEIGPKDMEKNQCVLVRRDNGEKVFVSLDELETAVPRRPGRHPRRPVPEGQEEPGGAHLPGQLPGGEAKASRPSTGLHQDHVVRGRGLRDQDEGGGGGMTSRCVPLRPGAPGDTCPICGRAAKK